MVSVIVPVYKVEPYLRQCVDSILCQTYKDIQVVLVDDGSPDCCGEIIDDYAQKDPRVIAVHQENGGLSAARNTGLEHATGEYVIFVDSDDYVEKDMIAVLMKLQEEIGVDIVGFRFYSFADGAEACESEKRDADLRDRAVIVSGEEAVAKMFRSDIGWMSCCKLYKKELFDELKFPVGYLCEDKATTYRVYLKAQKVAFIKEKLYYYRVQRKGSIMEQKSVKFYEDSIEITKVMEKELAALQNEEVMKRFNAYFAKFSFFCYSRTYNLSGYEHIAEQCLKEFIKRYKDIHGAEHLSFYEKWPIWLAGKGIKKGRPSIITKLIIKLFLYVDQARNK